MSVGRAELYPWSKLRKPGDWFFVESSFKTPGYISALVAQRNHKQRGLFRYSCSTVPGGAFVFLTKVEDDPIVGIEFADGIILHANKDEPLLLSQKQRIELMSMEMRMKILPWWHNENGKFVVNSRVATSEDKIKYLSKKEPPPGPNDPYPEYYNLTNNLTLKEGAYSVEAVNKYAWEDDEEEDTSYEEYDEYENDEIVWDHDYVLPENEEKPADDDDDEVKY